MARGARFGERMARRGKQFENSSEAAVKRAAGAGLRSAVLNTPVDKGVARSNWRVGLGAPTRSVIEAYSPYPKGSKGNGQGKSETANASAAISAGLARIAVKPKGAPIFLNNNVAYIGKISAREATIERSLIAAGSSLIGFKLFVDR